MESVNGLPAHVLLVHAPVVLVPLATLLALVLAARPSLRRRAGWALAMAAVLCLVATQLAVSSGEAFDEVLDGAANTDDHRELGETTRNLVVVFTLAAIGAAVLDRSAARRPAGDQVGSGDGGTGGRAATAALGLTVVAVAASVLATVWMVRTGEEGARLVWDGVLVARLP